jgi:hypothetical protein
MTNEQQKLIDGAVEALRLARQCLGKVIYYSQLTMPERRLSDVRESYDMISKVNDKLQQL